MQSITFDEFDAGLDVRKGPSVSDPNRLRVLKNAYVTTGKVIRKRPGLELIETFTGTETGTHGLFAGNGYLNTFYAGVAVGHSNNLFRMFRVNNPNGVHEIGRVDNADVFGGYMYASVLFTDGSRWHYWFDYGSYDTYNKYKAYSIGDVAEPAKLSGYGLRHVCTTPADVNVITAVSADANAKITTTDAHGLELYGVASIAGLLGPLFTRVQIESIEPLGKNSVIRTKTPHGLIAGEFARIRGIVDGKFASEINAVHLITSLIDDYRFSIGVGCKESVEPAFGWIGFEFPAGEPITQDFVVVKIEDDNNFMIAQEANGGAVTSGGVGVPSGTEPTWASTVGGTATAGDGTTVFTAESMYIDDSECPNTPSFTIAASKIWAIAGDVVKGCAVADARIWDASLDNIPGVILPVSSHAKGSSETTAVAQYDGRLAVFFEDSIQFWSVDPNPALDEYYKAVEGVGTKFPRTPREFAGDILFLASSGFRSVTTLHYSNQNLAETDTGSPVDKLVRPEAEVATYPHSEFYTAAGQYWCVMVGVPNSPVWAYTYSRTQKISAWALYEFPITIEYMAVFGSDLYVREGENVYKINSDETVYDDNGTEYEMRVEMPFLDFKKPTSTKHIISMDLVLTGTVNLQLRYDPNDDSFITDPIEITGDSRPYQSIPVEITTSAISPVFTSTSGEDVQIEAITFHYEEMGPV